VNITAFWHPALENSPSKHYHPGANRALPAVIFGVVDGEVGEIGDQRLAYPRAFMCVYLKDHSETRLWHDLLRSVRRQLGEDEVEIIDAGVKVSDLQEADLDRYVLRLAINFTPCRSQPASYAGNGRKPVYGGKVRWLLLRHHRRFEADNRLNL
jgi:hypothetical protein